MSNPIQYTLTAKDFKYLKATYPNMRSNHDICNYGVQVTRLYLKSKDYSNIKIEEKKVDIQGTLNNVVEKFEVKSTVDSDVAFGKLKVSSPKDYKSLVEEGMEIIRVCKVGQQTLDIYILKYGIDFTLTEEPRWRLVKKK